VAATIEWDKIAQLLWVAPLAGMVVAVTFALAIVGIARADDARRDGAGPAAFVYTALAVLAGGAFLGVVVYGVSVIINK
jgi:hypothetical protein